MSEEAHNPSQVESNTINSNTMVGGGKLSFIQKYYNFIKKYKFILFFFTTVTLGFLKFKCKSLVDLKTQTLA